MTNRYITISTTENNHPWTRVRPSTIARARQHPRRRPERPGISRRSAFLRLTVRPSHRSCTLDHRQTRSSYTPYQKSYIWETACVSAVGRLIKCSPAGRDQTSPLDPLAPLLRIWPAAAEGDTIYTQVVPQYHCLSPPEPTLQ